MPPDYLAYMLRLWQVKVNDRIKWRASLESPDDGERINFGTFNELVEYLQAQMKHKANHSIHHTFMERIGDEHILIEVKITIKADE